MDPTRRTFPWWCTALALVAWSCVGGPPEPPEPDEDQLFELYSTTATYLYEDEELLRAQDQAIKALDLRSDDKAMRRMIGWIRVRLGTSEDVIIAEQVFRQLVDEGDESGATILGMGTALERMGVGYADAGRQVRSGEREVPEDTDPEARADELGEIARDYWLEALEFYQRAITDGEGSTTAMNGLQRSHALLGDYTESLVWSARLLQRSSAELETWRGMLQAEDLTEEEENLYRDSERAAVLLQTNTHLFVARVLYELGRFDEAILHLDAVVRIEPQRAEVYSQRGQLHARMRSYDLAIEDLDHFLRLSEEPFEHPDVRRAFELRTECQERLARG